MREARSGGRASLLPFDHFVVASSWAVANHESGFQSERPAVSSEGRVVAARGRRHTTDAPIAFEEHAFFCFKRPRGCIEAIRAEEHSADVRNHHGPHGI